MKNVSDNPNRSVQIIISKRQGIVWSIARQGSQTRLRRKSTVHKLRNRTCAQLRLAGKIEGNRSFLHNGPAGIGIEPAHCGCCFCRRLSQILLEQHAILVDHECHHARITVFRRIGNEGEAACHLSIDHIVLRTARRLIGLPLQHAVVVAVKCRVSFGKAERRGARRIEPPRQ